MIIFRTGSTKWGAEVDTSGRFEQWSISKVHNWGLFKRLGIEAGWLIISVNKMRINAQNKEELGRILEDQFAQGLALQIMPPKKEKIADNVPNQNCQ